MPIVASNVLEDAAQRDGRRYITERHTDDVGLVYFRRYLAPADAVIDLVAGAAIVTHGLITTELNRDEAAILADGDLAVLTFAWCAVADLRARMREGYRNATRLEAVMIGAFLSTLTDAQLRALFNLTTAQTATLRTKVTTAKATLDALRAEAGQ